MWNLPHPTEKERELSPLLHRFMSILASAPTSMLLGTGISMDSSMRPTVSSSTHVLLDGSVHTDTVAQGVTRGSIIYANSTPKWDELVKGSPSQFFQSGASDVSWVTMGGDATLSGGTLTIANDAVTFAKFQNITDARLLGRSAGSDGDMQHITVGAGLTLASADLSGHWALLATDTPSAAASTVFTGLSSTYFAYKIVWSGLAPATDAVDLWFRTSTDAGATYDSGAGNYGHGRHQLDDSGAESAAGSTGDTKILVVSGVGNASNEINSGELTIFNPSAAAYCHVKWDGVFTTSAGTMVRTNGMGRRLAAADVDAVQLLFSSGNIASGTVKLYGLKA